MKRYLVEALNTISSDSSFLECFDKGVASLTIPVNDGNNQVIISLREKLNHKKKVWEDFMKTRELSDKFSETSKKRLKTCHLSLQYLFNAVIEVADCTIVCGHRPEGDQNLAYAQGVSKVKWPDGMHNDSPSKAVDVAPWIQGKGLTWDAKHCYHFAGVVLTIAHMIGIKIRWGGDWDGDRDLDDQTFNDLIHFQLVEDENTL